MSTSFLNYDAHKAAVRAHIKVERVARIVDAYIGPNKMSVACVISARLLADAAPRWHARAYD